ncbi:M23 family metallopeptidase [bacterium AH-315-J21]|nr:M23 family metallopeptidase [bacterium AH-315-J21]
MSDVKKAPISLRIVTGDETSVSIGGTQFGIWPPGRVTLSLVGVFVLLAIVLYWLTLGQIDGYQKQLNAQEHRLQAYRTQVMQLEANLMRAQKMVAQVAEMAGVEYNYEPLSSARDSAQDANDQNPLAGSSSAGAYPRDLNVPFGLPLQGFVSQLYSDSGSGAETNAGKKYHPGIDVAVGEGTPVLVTADGVVSFSGTDLVYGLTVIVRHNDTLSTLYGHNSKLLVTEGMPVIAGGRLALSGNTGRSSAPHLHYGILINDKAVNPARFLGDVE